MGMEEWSLACSWPPTGDQWQYSVDQFFEPLQLLDNKSDEAEYQLFNDDVNVQRNQRFNTAWSNDSSRLEEAVEQNVALASSYLMPALKHGDDVDTRSLGSRLSPWEELPSSPESFRLISNSELCGETGNNVQWQQESSLANTVSNQSLVASSLSDISGVELSDVATVPRCELSMEDMLLDLDEAISDVIMNPLKLADIGLYLPPVSADDVESLLSSPSIVAAGPPYFPATASCFPVHREELQRANPLILDMETSDIESNIQVYQEHVQAPSPVRSETEPYSVSAACSPVYEEQIQVPSPASSQSSVSTLSCDRKQRKKQQNKTAAQKYRQKKRGEQGLVMTEYEQLERRNIELRTRVEEMTREVDYLKGLIEEICA